MNTTYLSIVQGFIPIRPKVSRAMLLLTLAVACTFEDAKAQPCVPDPQYTQPGFYPFPGSALNVGTALVPYSDTLTFIVPTDTVLPACPCTGCPSCVEIDSIVVTGINGLPQGLSFQCAPPSCGFPGGTSGCVLISGVPADSGTYTVRVILSVTGRCFVAALGCNPLSSSVVDSLIYTMVVLPPLKATITDSTDAECFGDCNGEATVTAIDGTPPYTYLWSDPLGQTTPNATGLCAGVHSVTVTDSDGTTATDSVNILQPALIITFDTVSICDNDSAFLQNQWQTTAGTYYDTLTAANNCDSIVATNLVVHPTYALSDPDVAVCAGESTLIYGVSRSIAGTYYDSLLTVNGCDSVRSTVLTVNPVYSIVESPISICLGDSVLIYGTFRSVAGTYYDSLQTVHGCDSVRSTELIVNLTWLVIVPGFTICDGDSVSIFGTYQSIPGTYFDTLTTVHNCDSILAATLVVSPLPNVSVTPSPAVVCAHGDTVLLAASGAASYSWSPALGLSATTGDNVLAFPPSNVTYTVVGTSTEGCVDSTTVEYLLSTTTPVAGFSASPTSVCEGGTVTFSNSSTNAIGYSWWLPGGTTADTTAEHPAVTYNTPGNYDVTLTAFGCSADSMLTRTDYITVNPAYNITDPPIAACEGSSVLLYGVLRTTSGTYYDSLLTTSGCDSIRSTVLSFTPLPVVDLGPDTTLCFGCSITLDAGAGFPGYSWSTGATTQTIVVDTAGTYSVQVTDTNGCTGADTITVQIAIGINSPTFAGHPILEVRPNPTTGVLHLVYAGDGKPELRVYNSVGSLVLAQPLEPTIDISELGTGVYLLRVGNATETIVVLD